MKTPQDEYVVGKILSGKFDDIDITRIGQFAELVNFINLPFIQNIKNYYFNNLRFLDPETKMKNNQLLIKNYKTNRFIKPNKATYKKIYRDIQHEYEELMRKVIMQVQQEEKQLFQNLDPKILTLTILGLLNSIPQWYKKSGRLPADEIADQIYRMLTCA